MAPNATPAAIFTFETSALFLVSMLIPYLVEFLTWSPANSARHITMLAQPACHSFAKFLRNSCVSLAAHCFECMHFDAVRMRSMSLLATAPVDENHR